MRLLSTAAALLAAATTALADGHLLVLVSVDQLRQDYLHRFADDLRAGGFGMFRERGAVFPNAHFDYASTETGPGHATIGTGAYGATHGIVGNGWYDRVGRRPVYCVEDSAAPLLGAPGPGRSPRLLIGSTIGDELRLGSGFRSRVISISYKDRAAILMAGKFANGAYWFVDSAVVTSTYYARDLPGWVARFNRRGRINAYFGTVWDRALPEERYRGLDRDDAPYESAGGGLGRTFPRTIDGGNPSAITSGYYAALRASPFSNELVMELALEALHEEELGRRGVTDMLAVSFSANDYVGHGYGPHSHEVFDLTVRTDSLLARLWAALDRTLGAGNWTAALTADHGVAPIPEYIDSVVPGSGARRVDGGELLRLAVARAGAEGWIERAEGDNIYLSPQTVAAAGLSTEEAAERLAAAFLALPEVYSVHTAARILGCPATTPVERRIRNSYHAARSGDLVVVLKPYLLPSGYPSGTTHGSPHPYDSHVPLMIAGPGVRPGTYDAPASPADIAPTLAALRGIERPSQATGRVLVEAVDRSTR